MKVILDISRTFPIFFAECLKTRLTRMDGAGGAHAKSASKVGVAYPLRFFCVIGGAAFLFSELYHLNPAWLFFAWNSILFIPVIA